MLIKCLARLVDRNLHHFMSGFSSSRLRSFDVVVLFESCSVRLVGSRCGVCVCVSVMWCYVVVFRLAVLLLVQSLLIRLCVAFSS